MSGVWVLDSSVIIILGRAGLLHLLEHRLPLLRVPQSVADEINAGPDGDGGKEWLSRHQQLVTSDVLVPRVFTQAAKLGDGERSVLSLAASIQGSTAVLDDAAGRRTADVLEIPYIGTVGILMHAKRAGIVEEIRPLLQAVRTSGLYFSQAIEEEILKEMSE